jgi:molybdate transport system ATP-binding protein
MKSPAPQAPITLKTALNRGAFTLDVDLSLPGRGVSAIFGPSGSGKSTILRIMAGLERSATGRIEVDGQQWQDSGRKVFLPPHARGIGYVFQEANLFPHLSVRNNLLYGQRRTGTRMQTVDLDSTITLLGIGHLLERFPENLSGGERQRVAIARALLASPRILLLDEPLASLDLERKREVLPYLERLHETLEIPVILVSHALDEVLRLSDHLSLIRDGKIITSGPLQQTLSRLELPEIQTRDIGVVLDGKVIESHSTYGLIEVEVAGMRLQVTHGPLPKGRRLRLQIQSCDVSLALEKPQASSVLNLIPATIVRETTQEEAPHVHLLLDASGSPLIARITRLSRDRLQLSPGTPVWAQIKAVAVIS